MTRMDKMSSADKMAIKALLNMEELSSTTSSALNQGSSPQRNLSEHHSSSRRDLASRESQHAGHERNHGTNPIVRHQTSAALSSSLEQAWPYGFAHIPPATQPLSRESQAQYPPHTTYFASVNLNTIKEQPRRQSIKREARPTYTEEEQMFIWYFRTDLEMCWDDVHSEFLRHGFRRRDKGGLQCKFYRVLSDWDVPKVRSQAKKLRSEKHNTVGQFGLVQRTTRRYSWMSPEHQTAPPLPEYAGASSPRGLSRHSCNDSDCNGGCGW